MGREPGEKGVSYSGEVMIDATPKQMELFDEEHLNGDRQTGGSNPDAIAYYPGGYGTLSEINAAKAAGEGGMWRLSGGARRYLITARRRFTMRRNHIKRRRSMKRKTRRRRVTRR